MYCRHHVVSLTSKLGPTFIQTNRSISIASIPLVPDDDQALSPAENYEESKAQLDSVKTFSGNSGRQSNYSGYSGFERSLTRHGWLRERERESVLQRGGALTCRRGRAQNSHWRIVSSSLSLLTTPDADADL